MRANSASAVGGFTETGRADVTGAAGASTGGAALAGATEAGARTQAATNTNDNQRWGLRVTGAEATPKIVSRRSRRLAGKEWLGYQPPAMRITEFLKLEAVIPAINARNKTEVIAELAAIVAKTVPSIPSGRFLEVLNEREKVGSTGMEKGVAIPHGRLPELQQLVACFGVSKEGVDFDARDNKPSHFFFALVAPENSAGVHLKALSKVSRLFRSDSLRDAILAAPTAEAIYALISQEDGKA